MKGCKPYTYSSWLSQTDGLHRSIPGRQGLQFQSQQAHGLRSSAFSGLLDPMRSASTVVSLILTKLRMSTNYKWWEVIHF